MSAPRVSTVRNPVIVLSSSTFTPYTFGVSGDHSFGFGTRSVTGSA